MRFATLLTLSASVALATKTFDLAQDAASGAETEVEVKKSACELSHFCKEFMAMKDYNMKNPEGPISSYTLGNVMVTGKNQLFGTLTNPAPMKNNSGTVNMFMSFFQDGIMRCQLTVDGEERFAISSTGVGVNWEGLTQVTDLQSRLQRLGAGVQLNFTSTDGLDQISYYLQYKPFRIVQYVNGYASLVGNAFDTLQFSAPDAPHDFYYIENDQVVTGYEIGMSFILQTERIWGLPQRAADMFQLSTAGANDPYRLFNQDKYWHPYGSLDPLYGSYPYLTGHLTNADMSVLWMNSAETFVQINDTNNSFESDAFAMLGSFTSVGGAFEFWAIGSANGPKQNHKYLTEITGRPPMPPVHSLGFHYSKYEENSADLMLTRNEEFTKYGFPVDVFWSDLYYTEQFEYFVFNYENWPIDKVDELNRAIALS